MQLQTTSSESKFPIEYSDVIFIQIDQHLKKLLQKYKGVPILWNTVYTKWCAQSFPPIIWIFAIFDRKFAKMVAPPSSEYENYVVFLKEQSILEKTLKTASKSGNKQQRNACSNYATLERTVLRTRSVTNKKTKKLETKASPRRQCTPAGYCHTNAH